MGLFLAMSCVVGGRTAAVVKSLSAFVDERKGSLEPCGKGVKESEAARLLEKPAGTTVVYPDGFLEWDAASARLSHDLNAPVFSFHIHDGDLWMFVLFVNGKEAAKFNPIPDYWEELPAKERATWLPKAEQVAKHVPGVVAKRIAPYLREWPEDGLEGKAHPKDEFEYIDWQVVDFMRELGFAYPEPEDGVTYRMKVKRNR
jgi:hypothetical protein